jgi:hypothetical protein
LAKVANTFLGDDKVEIPLLLTQYNLWRNALSKVKCSLGNDGRRGFAQFSTTTAASNVDRFLAANHCCCLACDRPCLDQTLLNTVRVEGSLPALEQLHQRTFSTYGHLNSPEFFASRQQLYRQLDAQLKSAFLNKQLNLGSYDTLRRDLGISTKSLVHHWSRAGASGEIPGYATHLDQVAKTAKYLKYGGHVGVALGGGASLLKVQEVCRSGETEACKRIRFTEAGSFSGGLGGGAVGALI